MHHIQVAAMVMRDPGHLINSLEKKKIKNKKIKSIYLHLKLINFAEYFVLSSERSGTDVRNEHA